VTDEERVARLILEEHDLEPPVEVEDLARHFAEVEEVHLPVAGDAVVIRYPGDRQKPKILLNADTVTPGRKRFTLAHEIGHIVIPWHFGTFACHHTDEDVLAFSDYATDEAEANRFASELLMPTPWVEKIIEASESIGETFTTLYKTAGVSYDAARIKLLNLLPPGYVCISDTRPDTPIRIGASRGTRLELYLCYNQRRGLDKIEDVLDTYASDSFAIERTQGGIKWWRLDASREVPKEPFQNKLVNLPCPS